MQRTWTCREQLCTIPLSEQRGHAVPSRYSSRYLLRGKPVPSGLLPLFLSVLWSWARLRWCCNHQSAQTKPKSSLPSLQSCTVLSETRSHYDLFPTWLLPFQNNSFHFQRASRSIFSISEEFLGDRQDLTKTKTLSGDTASFLFVPHLSENWSRVGVPTSCSKASKHPGLSKEKSIRHGPFKQLGRKTEWEVRGEKGSLPGCVKLNKNNKGGGGERFNCPGT